MWRQLWMWYTIKSYYWQYKGAIKNSIKINGYLEGFFRGIWGRTRFLYLSYKYTKQVKK